jgi:hypothetical protein
MIKNESQVNLRTRNEGVTISWALIFDIFSHNKLVYLQANIIPYLK